MLDKISDLLKKAQSGTISQAEFLMLKDFDLAELSLYEQARDLTIDLLNKWLTQYKFKNWNTHETSQSPVTEEDKKNRAQEIAQALGDYHRWKSHARPLGIQTLRGLNLQIDDFGQDAKKSELILGFHQLLEDYMRMCGTGAVVFIRKGDSNVGK